jgi:hypothetical protein
MDKPTLICDSVEEKHGSNKPYVHDVNLIKKVSWKVVGFSLFRKKCKAVEEEIDRLQDQGIFDIIDFPEVLQIGLMKLCEHRSAKM